MIEHQILSYLTAGKHVWTVELLPRLCLKFSGHRSDPLHLFHCHQLVFHLKCSPFSHFPFFIYDAEDIIIKLNSFILRHWTHSPHLQVYNWLIKQTEVKWLKCLIYFMMHHLYNRLQSGCTTNPNPNPKPNSQVCGAIWDWKGYQPQCSLGKAVHTAKCPCYVSRLC